MTLTRTKRDSGLVVGSAGLPLLITQPMGEAMSSVHISCGFAPATSPFGSPRLHGCWPGGLAILWSACWLVGFCCLVFAVIVLSIGVFAGSLVSGFWMWWLGNILIDLLACWVLLSVFVSRVLSVGLFARSLVSGC